MSIFAFIPAISLLLLTPASSWSQQVLNIFSLLGLTQRIPF